MVDQEIGKLQYRAPNTLQGGLKPAYEKSGRATGCTAFRVAAGFIGPIPAQERQRPALPPAEVQSGLGTRLPVPAQLARGLEDPPPHTPKPLQRTSLGPPSVQLMENPHG
jgi:hypothetical protein